MSASQLQSSPLTKGGHKDSFVCQYQRAEARPAKATKQAKLAWAGPAAQDQIDSAKLAGAAAEPKDARQVSGLWGTIHIMRAGLTVGQRRSTTACPVSCLLGL
eukprot:scaffold66360_cov20-Prasinocladus_malaysianus.AAC.1